jgi:hypothetical protein
MSTSSAVIGVVLANMATSFEPVVPPSYNSFRVAVISGGGPALIAFLLAALIPGRRPPATAVDSSAGPQAAGVATE